MNDQPTRTPPPQAKGLSRALGYLLDRLAWLVKSILRRVGMVSEPPEITDAARRGSATSTIWFELESMTTGTTRSTGLVDVSGWACAETGIAGVEVYLDDVLLSHIDIGRARPDVAAVLPNLPGAAYSGFSKEVDLSDEQPGKHTMVVLIRDRAGHTTQVTRLIDLLEVAEATVEDDSIKCSLDSPGLQTSLTTGSVSVAGWALSKSGIEAIDVYLDGEFRKTLATGLARPDLEALYPDIPGASHCGFTDLLDLRGGSHGDHTVALVVRCASGRTARVERTVRLVENEQLYQRYYLASLPRPDEERRMIEQCSTAGPRIAFELWVHVNVADSAQVPATLDSIRGQAYPHWRVQLIDPTNSALPSGPESRITTATAADFVVDPNDSAAVFAAFLHAGETLSPGALSRAACFAATRPKLELFYSDHDAVRPDGLHVAPVFNPDWSPDHVLARNYVGGIYFIRKSTAVAALFQRLVKADGSAWRYDLLLRLSEHLSHLGHVPELLWSQPVDVLSVRHDGELAVVQETLQRRAWQAEALDTEPGVRRIRWQHEHRPSVSIVIATTGALDLLRRCVESLEKTQYPNYEVVFIDNSRGAHPDGIDLLRSKGFHIIERNEPFNWARLNNAGAHAASGEVLLFLNDDIEVIDPFWLDDLANLAWREEIGAVGALLLYPDERIQHAGVFLVDHGVGGRHLLRGESRKRPAYQNLDRVTREVSCTTGACLMIRRQLFEQLGGFDESLEIVGNDIDLCLRALRAGYRNLWTPYSALIHHESVSRRESNIVGDESKMWERWGELLRRGDPYYNVNLAPYSSDLALNLDLLRDWERGRRSLSHQPDER